MERSLTKPVLEREINKWIDEYMEQRKKHPTEPKNEEMKKIYDEQGKIGWEGLQEA